MLKDILKLKGAQVLSKAKQKSVNGGMTEVDGYCCFNAADYYMQDVPHYSDPSAPGYLTHSQRHDIWLQAYDGCMAGMEAVCAPAQ